MDVATLVGIIAAFGLVAFSILSGAGSSTFIEPKSILIVFGGTFGATLIAFPLGTITGVVGVIRKAFFFRGQDNAEIIQTLEELATRARKEGLLSLQALADSVDDPFYKSGLQLVIDGQEADTIEAILTTDLQYVQQRHAVGADIMNTMGTFAPAFGMIGTIIGLIQMLANMEDPSSIGPAMAVALVTTFYGALLANVVFLPMVTKLQRRSAAEVEQKTLILEGLLSIHAGDNPRILVQKLRAFLAPRERAQDAA
ncbi:MAG TPA: motility protein A [Deltaproteobacteria bacterium]|nr:motility protein A [Deltaproteobacteria bacterium]HCP45371.1 motility protein A [Deltaproteobacteria bacterium]